MRLYTNKDGQWFGTQRDAQKGAPRNLETVSMQKIELAKIKKLEEE